MTREQRLRYDMLDRVRTFGNVHRDVFPETTGGGRAFAQVSDAVRAIEAHLARRVQARAEARKVKTTTREAVTRAMKALAATGRRAAVGETLVNPFRMPARRSATVVLSTARTFLGAAEQRQARFVELGMAPTFLDDFRALVDGLDEAIRLQRSSRSSRRQADGGLSTALARGMSACRDLDVTVPNVLANDAERLAAWAGARRIDGQRPSGRVKVEATAEPASEATSGPVMEKAS